MASRIVAVTLDGYRTHAHLVVALDSAVTVLTGPNQSGKSNVVRALRWLALNEDEPLDRVLSPGASTVKVRADLADGGYVERERSRKANLYRLRAGTGGDVVELAKVGAGAIPEVTEILGLRPVNIGRSTVLVSFQGVDWRSPLDLSPVDFAGLLGAVSGAARVEAAVKAASSALHGLRGEVKEADRAADTSGAEVARLSVAAQIPALLDRVQALQAQGCVHRERLRGVAGLLADLRALDASTVDAVAVQTAKARLASVNVLWARHTGLWDRLNRIRGLGRELQAADAQVASLQQAQAQAREAFAEGLRLAGVCPLCGAATGGAR